MAAALLVSCAKRRRAALVVKVLIGSLLALYAFLVMDTIVHSRRQQGEELVDDFVTSADINNQ